MRKNMGHGCDGKHGCQPEPSCDVVKSRSTFCEAEPFVGGVVEERTVIADVLLETLVEADITLPTNAIAIKNIRKNVRLTQCKALSDSANPNAVKLFVEGVVHKNIQYVEECNGCVKDYSVEIPFRCYDRVTPLANPVAFPFGNEFSVKSNVFEVKELDKKGHGADPCTSGSLTFEIYNEPIKCKLLASAVNQWDIIEEKDRWGRFNKITEKMDVFLVLKLTQLQQPDFIPPTGIPTSFDPSGTDSLGQETIYNKFRRITGR